MKWTTEQPTEPGWYWLNHGYGATIVNIGLGFDDGLLRIERFGDVVSECPNDWFRKHRF